MSKYRLNKLYTWDGVSPSHVFEVHTPEKGYECTIKIPVLGDSDVHAWCKVLNLDTPTKDNTDTTKRIIERHLAIHKMKKVLTRVPPNYTLKYISTC